MTERNEIDYREWIDRLIPDLPPVKRLWRPATRLSLWILLEALLLALGVTLKYRSDLAGALYLHNYGIDSFGFVLASIAAGWIALTASIPGDGTGKVARLLFGLGIGLGLVGVHLGASTPVPFSIDDFPATLIRQVCFAGLPWVALFGAVWRAAPMRPKSAGVAVGLAAACFGIAAAHLTGPPVPLVPQFAAAGIVTMLSAGAGALWLAPARLWRPVAAQAAESMAKIRANAILWASGAFAAAILIAGLRIGAPAIPDFDLAIQNYQQSLTGFRANVPSQSLAALLTSYIEHGMPAYMWDFGAKGFRLIGGRFGYLPGRIPVTYTWFRGNRAGVMCMIRQVNGFQAPALNRVERNHMFFYRYHGYSVCLINIGGYGDFISVIVSPIPLQRFMPMVLATLSNPQT
jgi:hypothetical protein